MQNSTTMNDLHSDFKSPCQLVSVCYNVSVSQFPHKENMDNKYLYNVVVIQIQRVISSRAFKNNGTWTSVEGVWLYERRQNHLSPEVGGWQGIPTLLLLQWTRGLRRRPSRSSRRGGVWSQVGGAKALGQPSWDSMFCSPALSQAQGLRWLGWPLTIENGTIIKIPGYFLFLLLLWQSRDKGTETPFE